MLIIKTDSISKYKQLTHQICFLPNSDVLERSNPYSLYSCQNYDEKCTLKDPFWSIYFFAYDDENPYPLRNTPHLACVNFIDHVTVNVVTAHCMAACVSAITSPRSGPPPSPTHTHKHILWVVDWLSLKPDILHVSECRPALADYKMTSHSCPI